MVNRSVPFVQYNGRENRRRLPLCSDMQRHCMVVTLMHQKECDVFSKRQGTALFGGRIEKE
jgi:hypothetical protein